MTKQELSQRIKAKYPQYANVDDIELADKIIAKYPVYGEQISEKGGLLNKIVTTTKGILTEAGEKTKERAIEAADVYAEKKNLPATALSSLAVPATAINETVFGALKAVLPQGFKNDIKSFIQSVATNPKVREDIIEPLSRVAKENPQSAQAAQDLLDIASAIPVVGAGIKGVQQTAKQGTRLAKAGVSGVEAVGTGARTLAGDVKNVALKSGEKLQGITTKAPTPIKAVGQVLQGKADDIATGIKSLSALDTTGVKTFQELGGRITSKIKELSRQVDTELAKDTVKKTLDDLFINAKTKAGEIVQIRPVENALNQLDELYAKIGDTVRQADIQDLMNIAKTEGLTTLELNNLAREYGMEFGSKAFNKMGDALTSVNAQMFENTRKNLKDLARSGITGNAAKVADETISSLYNTQALIKKNIEAVNKIQQKINERGLLEKIGNTVAKYGDLLTGGSLRGFVGGLLPRGAGYKVMNALDIEEVLQRNLKIINDAIKSGSDKELINTLKKLNKETTPLKSSPLPSSKSILGTPREFAKNISGEYKNIESRAFARVDKDWEKILDDYKSKYGNVVNSYSFRPYFKADGYNGSNAAAVQEPSSELAKMAWANGLKNEGQFATLFAGGSGTGKTSAIKNIELAKDMVDNSAVILDGNLSSYGSAIKKIKQANDAGKVSPILYVYREPVDAMINGVVKRSINNIDEMGRIVPTKVVADNHIGSWKTVKRLAEEGNTVISIDNSLGAKNAKIVPLNDLTEKVKYPSVEELTKLLNEEIKRLYENKIKIGKRAITEEEYKAYIK